MQFFPMSWPLSDSSLRLRIGSCARSWCSTAVGAAAYTWWFLGQPEWGLKTKYILFLLPAFVVYVICGFAWIHRHAPSAATLTLALLLIALLVALHAYLFAFSIG